MASRIKIINALRPRVELDKTVQKGELVEYMAARTGQNEGAVDLGIKELRDAIIFFNRAGRSVKVEGLGTWTPNIGLDGTLDVQYRADTFLTNRLNDTGTFTGNVGNRENVGKEASELVTKWNTDHPDDQVTD
jgi:hypothetical protein